MDSRIVVVVFAAALFGPAMVSAQITSCVNESTLITKMNGYATNFSTAFSSILSNVSIPQADKTMRILGAVCNDSMIRPRMDDIEIQLKLCSTLIANSNLKNLTLGPLKFTDLFMKFTSVANVCGCVQPLLSTLAVTDMKSVLLNTSSALHYQIVEVTKICEDYMKLKTHVTVISDNLQTCPIVLQFSSGFLTSNNVKMMKDFATQVCPSFNATKLRCAVDTSASTSFKNCMNAPNTTTSCKKRACVISSVPASCAAGNDPYMWSVNMITEATFELMGAMCATEDGTLDGTGDATTAIVSTITLLVALMSSFLIL